MSAAGGRDRSRWEALLPRFSLDRRITVLVLLATILVVGVVAAIAIPLELFPQGFTPSYLSVQVPWQDAPAQEVLDKIVKPLEEELSTVRGLDGMSSRASTGYARLGLRFKHGTDMAVAYREVRDRVERARARMPEDAEKVFIRKDDVSGIPVVFLGLLVDPELGDAYDLIQNQVVLPLQRLDGVASVTPNGLEEKEILIELDRERTEAAGLNIYQLAQELSGDNFTLASGSVRAGGRKLLLRSVARYPDRAALENRLVAPSVRLEDIAEVRYEEPEKRYRIRVNSMPAIGVQVVKEGDANTLEVTRAIRAEVERLQEDPRLAGLEMEILFDQGEVILESLDTLVDSGKVGGVFAFAVLFFFLRRFRMTMIIALSIPLSIVIALTVMFFAGETLNILSLLGLIICVGLLVDNSVVVAENIHRLHGDGLGRREAAIHGAGEIALAIVMATLTTVAVFLPVSLVEGEAQFFLLRLSLPISVSLLGSLVVALVFVPLSVYLTLSDANGHGERGLARTVARRLEPLGEPLRRTLGAVYDATLGRLNDLYGRVLAFFLGHRLDLWMILLAVFALTGWVLEQEKVRFVDQDENERAGFAIEVRVPRSYTFEEAEAYFLEIEEVLEAKQEAWGLEGYFFWHGTRGGHVEGFFTNPKSTELTPRQVTELALEALPQPPGVKLFTGSGDEEAEDDKLATHTFTLHGEDATELAAVEETLEEIFSKVDGVLGVRQSEESTPNEMSLVVDRERARRQQVNPAVIAGVVGYALRGQALPEYHVDGREIPVRVRFAEEDRESLTELASFAVPTGTGEVVPLSSLTDVRFEAAPASILRRDKRLARTVTLELEEGREEATRERLFSVARELDLPEGVTFGGGERREAMDEGVVGLLFAAGLSVVFIYLLMGFLFESFILPLSILSTIPLAGIGVVWAHLATGRNIDFLGTVGLVLLIGVVVNNGIVLVDYVNRLRKAGHDRAEALRLATHRRFRPIMMTALTTICGLIPLTLGGASSIGLSYTSFGYTLIGGLTTATLLTLLVVPVFYTHFDDLRELLAWVLARGRGRLGGEAAEAEPAE